MPGWFCRKRNKENGRFLFDVSGYEMFLLTEYHYNKLYLVMYLVVKCEYIMNL